MAPGPKPSRAARPEDSWPAARWDGSFALAAPPAAKSWAFVRGRYKEISRAAAASQGFTVVDLSDDWTPILFTERSSPSEPIKPFPYRRRYLDLANDRTDHHGRRLRQGQHNYLELYGIPPSLSVIRRRFLNQERRKCLEKVDVAGLKALEQTLTPWAFKHNIRRHRVLEAQVKRRLRKKRFTRPEQLAATRYGRRLLKDYRRTERRAKAAQAAIGVLRCEGILHKRRPLARLSGRDLYNAITKYERRHMIFGRGRLTREAASAMARSADDADADAFRRVLRERITHAAGILEDGTAAGVAKTYFDGKGVKRPVPNLVSAALEATLRHLSLDTTAAIAHFVRALDPKRLRHLTVAVKLPPPPDYYSANMKLDVVIDRGDVWYGRPVNSKGHKIYRTRHRHPNLTLWVTYGDQRIPLVHWPTTIGGWNDEMRDGLKYLRYKESNVGRRIWRDVIAAPVWIPPPSTPPEELLSYGKVDKDLMGPGHLSAFGLVASLHLWPRQRRGRVYYQDQGIRTHGSFNYRSIRRGFSHGCHRLHNHRALRLFSFILRHRPHERLGLEEYRYRRKFEHKDKEYEIKIRNRGYVYRLAEPVPVNVLEGNILGPRKVPYRGFLPKPGVEYPPDGGVRDGGGSDGGTPATIGGPTGDAGVGAPAPRPALRAKPLAPTHPPPRHAPPPPPRPRGMATPAPPAR